jgi:hypothetical protein
MKTIEIKSQADWDKLQALTDAEPLQVLLKTPVIKLPRITTPWRRSNVTFDASQAPGGYCLFTGGCFALVGCETVSCKRIAFRIERPSDLPKGALEKSWKPLRIHAESPDKPCRNIHFENCSFSGHTDEIEVGPADHGTWFKNTPDKIAAYNVSFVRCSFALPFQNYTRGDHNMNISASLVDGLLFDETVFMGANRRSGQCCAKNVLYRHTVHLNWGGMNIGLHAGSSAQLQSCHFVPGPNTKLGKLPVSIVEDTFKSDLGVLGEISLAITKTCKLYKSLAQLTPVKEGWDCFRVDPGVPLPKKTTALAVPPVKPLADLVRNAGCGDALDKAIVEQVVGKRLHVPWMYDYTAPFLFPAR